MASAGLPGTKVVAPGRRLSWTMWKTGTRLSRAQRRVSAIRTTALGPSGRTTLPIGAKYSCWASMMRSAVLSIVASPRSARHGGGLAPPFALGRREPAADPGVPRERPLLLEHLLVQL